jgi:hypothetical protein
MLESGERNEALLSACEARDNIFPNLDWKHYL